MAEVTGLKGIFTSKWFVLTAAAVGGTNAVAYLSGNASLGVGFSVVMVNFAAVAIALRSPDQ